MSDSSDILSGKYSADGLSSIKVCLSDATPTEMLSATLDGRLPWGMPVLGGAPPTETTKIYLGTVPIKRLYVGNATILKAYFGSNLIQ